MKGLVIVSFGEPVTFWTGYGNREAFATDRRLAHVIPSEEHALHAWRSLLAVEPARDLWIVRDWGLDSERTIATRDEGVFGGAS